MANKSFRKSQLIAFDNVAAGQYVTSPHIRVPLNWLTPNHSDGVLSDPSGAMIVKPCKQSEIDFYESTSSHPGILPFIPTYMGRLSLGSDTAQAAGALILPGETTPDELTRKNTAELPVLGHAWEPSNGGKIDTDHAVVLENIAADYKKPNILDVKLGARLWADDAPAEKRAKLDKAAAETTSKPLGFRIAGMKTYQGSGASEGSNVTAHGYRLFDKHYGRSFIAQTVQQGFNEFFRLQEGVQPSGAIRKVINRFIRDLQDIADAIGKEESRMYSASLLFVYEGDASTLDVAFSEEKDLLSSYHGKHQSGNGTVNGNGSTNGTSSGTNGISDEADDDDKSEEDQPSFPSIQSLKLIDFAHAEWTPGQGPDENLLHGMRSVIKMLIGMIH
ncbi:MAG: hypothetical protein Q9164_005683 [Protoblastenia rupestris]